jgi:hypothetical protein
MPEAQSPRETVWKIAEGSRSRVIGNAKRQEGRLFARFTDSWDPILEPIWIYQTVSERLFSETRIQQLVSLCGRTGAKGP